MTIDAIIEFCNTEPVLFCYTVGVILLLWLIPWAISKRG